MGSSPAAAWGNMHGHKVGVVEWNLLEHHTYHLGIDTKRLPSCLDTATEVERHSSSCKTVKQ